MVMEILFTVFLSPCEVKLHAIKSKEGVVLACCNLVYYFTLRMEIGFKKAPTWRFSGIGKIYGSGTFSVTVLFFLRPGKNVTYGWKKTQKAYVCPMI